MCKKNKEKLEIIGIVFCTVGVTRANTLNWVKKMTEKLKSVTPSVFEAK